MIMIYLLMLDGKSNRKLAYIINLTLTNIILN